VFIRYSKLWPCAIRTVTSIELWKPWTADLNHEVSAACRSAVQWRRPVCPSASWQLSDSQPAGAGGRQFSLPVAWPAASVAVLCRYISTVTNTARYQSVGTYLSFYYNYHYCYHQNSYECEHSLHMNKRFLM